VTAADPMCRRSCCSPASPRQKICSMASMCRGTASPAAAEIRPLAATALANFNLADAAATVPALLELRARLAALPADPLVDDKRAQLDTSLSTASGYPSKPRCPTAEVLPGASLALHHTATVRATIPVRWVGVHYPASKSDVSEAIALSAGVPATRDTVQTLPIDTPLTQPYWLREDGAAGIARVADPTLIGLPENPPVFPSNTGLKSAARRWSSPMSRSRSNRASRQRLGVIPPVSLRFVSDVALFAPNSSRSLDVEVISAISNAAGHIKLELPDGWQITPTVSQTFV